MSPDEEREALARLIDAHYDDYEPVYNEGGEAVSSTLADAILASDVWRNRQGEVVSERHTFATDACVTRECDCAARPVITGEAVERAYKAALRSGAGQLTRADIRSALEAVFGENHQPEVEQSE